jgi:cell division inhibitor SepF
MAAMWRKAMLYLGLGPDDEYDDYEPGYDDPAPREPQPRSRPQPQQSVYGPPPDEPSAIGAVRPIGQREPLGGDSPSGAVATRPRPQVVRPITVTPNAKPNVVVPTSFEQAQEVADTFKRSQPVIVNLQAADRDLARRLIDFASGLCYGLGGQMEKVANQVYLLTPSNVEVSAEERRRLHERGYDS